MAFEKSGFASGNFRLGCPDIAVRNPRGICISANDDAAWIYPESSTEEDGSGRDKRRERAIAPQKRVSNAGGIDPFPCGFALGIARSYKRKNRAGEIDRGVRPVVEQVPV